MQTFTPYADFAESLRALDLKRLGKQRVEVVQIVRALTVPGYAWSSHPAVLMWKGYEEALGRYGLTACEVWTERGFGDSCAATITADLRAAGIAKIGSYEELAASDALTPWLRAQRTAEKLVQDMGRVRKKRSAAAKRGWKTRLDKAKREAERLSGEARD